MFKQVFYFCFNEVVSFFCRIRVEVIEKLEDLLGIITIDGVKEYQLGDTFDVTLAEIRSTTRQLIAKPVKQFPAPEATENTDASATEENKEEVKA